LWPQFVSLKGRVEDFLERDELPSRIECFCGYIGFVIKKAI
jgi:hypothetical protein